MRDFEEQLDILFSRVFQQEGADRLAGFFDGLLLGERALLQRGPGLVVDLREDRADDEQGQAPIFVPSLKALRVLVPSR